MMLKSCPNFTHPIIDKNDSTTSGIVINFPNVPDNVAIGLTTFYMVTYSVVFFGVYAQLWFILHYNYKRFSFQTVFLYLCLIWSGLRATLFSFYVNNTMKATKLPAIFYWLLYCFPVCLQFCTLCLLSLYFAQVMFKAKSKYAANPSKYKIPLRTACILAISLFFIMNISCAAVVHKEAMTKDPVNQGVRILVFTRVLINDLLFVISAVSLAFCLFKIAKTTSPNILLEAKGTTVCRSVSIGVVIILLYVSRSLYNLVAISPLRCPQSSSLDFEWYNVSDQAELANLNHNVSYVVFGGVLFVWEFLPTSLTILFFKVSKPETAFQRKIGNVHETDQTPRAYFLDDPRHHSGSEDDLASNSLSRSLEAPLLA